jgi:hypothetical protein
LWLLFQNSDLVGKKKTVEFIALKEVVLIMVDLLIFAPQKITKYLFEWPQPLL